MQIPLVLVAEDEALITDILRETLEDGGFKVIFAENGKAAIDAIKECSELEGLITDIRLGSGPDGWQVAQHARHRFSEIAVVYISGDSGHEWMEKGVPKSILVQKPFAPAQIITGVSTLLNKADNS
jgi:CheY-like chemotaxis protein